MSKHRRVATAILLLLIPAWLPSAACQSAQAEPATNSGTVLPGNATRLYVERIDIHGNTRTRDDVIRREFDFGEGDAYNRALIDRAERRLQGLGYFKSVKINTQPGSAPDRVVLDVAVEEDKTGSFSIMGGYSSADGPEATISIGDKNFLGTGDIAKASLTYGEYAKGFDLSFTDPYALGPAAFARRRSVRQGDIRQPLSIL